MRHGRLGSALVASWLTLLSANLVNAGDNPRVSQLRRQGYNVVTGRGLSTVRRLLAGSFQPERMLIDHRKLDHKISYWILPSLMGRRSNHQLVDLDLEFEFDRLLGANKGAPPVEDWSALPITPMVKKGLRVAMFGGGLGALREHASSFALRTLRNTLHDRGPDTEIVVLSKNRWAEDNKPPGIGFVKLDEVPRQRYLAARKWAQSADLLYIADESRDSLVALSEALSLPPEKMPLIALGEATGALNAIVEQAPEWARENIISAFTKDSLNNLIAHRLNERVKSTKRNVAVSTHVEPTTAHPPATPSVAAAPVRTFESYWTPLAKPKSVSRVEEFPISSHPVRIAVLGQGSSADVSYSVTNDARKIGEEVARLNAALITGGGNGVPRAAATAAFERSGETWAVSPAMDTDNFVEQDGQRASKFTRVFATNTGGGSGSVTRSAPLLEVSNVGLVVAGGPGTLAEVVAAMYRPGVLGFLRTSGGVAARGRQWMEALGKPDTLQVVDASDPTRLVKRAVQALAGAGAAPTKAYTAVGRPKNIFDETSRANRQVISFLAEDQRISFDDGEKVARLAQLVSRAQPDGTSPFVIVPDRTGNTTQRVLAEISRSDATAVVVNSGKGRNSRSAKKWNVNLGYGDGMGRFVAGRETVEQSNVIFLTSAAYDNMAGLVHALKRSGPKPTIAILELTSTHSDKLNELLTSIGVSKRNIVFSRDPERLLIKLQDMLQEKKTPPRFEQKPQLSPVDRLD